VDILVNCEGEKGEEEDMEGIDSVFTIQSFPILEGRADPRTITP
jgi:hypothetical protein